MRGGPKREAAGETRRRYTRTSIAATWPGVQWSAHLKTAPSLSTIPTRVGTPRVRGGGRQGNDFLGRVVVIQHHRIVGNRAVQPRTSSTNSCVDHLNLPLARAGSAWKVLVSLHEDLFYFSKSG
jgi:hypothetical protein